MGLYQERVVPWLTHLSMRNRDLLPYRRRAVADAAGRVLEIGIGPGLNLPLYGDGVSAVLGLDPSPRLLAKAAETTRATMTRPLRLIEGTAEALPLEDRSIDTVVTTWTLCSISDVGRALAEMRRVLRPSGRLLFVEHGRAPEPRVRWWQDTLTPAWERLAGGCHLNRAISELIESSGFHIERLDTGYMHGRNPLAFMYEGRAQPR